MPWLLLVVAVLLFGGAALFASKRTLVSYFPGSVQGLREGSSVVLNGVRIGYVKSIRLQGEVKPDNSMEMLVQVTMEILPSSFELYSNGSALSVETRAQMSPQQYVDAGIRAKLGHGELRHRSAAGGTGFPARHAGGAARADERRTAGNSDDSRRRAADSPARADFLRQALRGDRRRYSSRKTCRAFSTA